MAELVCGIDAAPLLRGPIMLGILLHWRGGFQMHIWVRWRQFERSSSGQADISATNFTFSMLRADVTGSTLRDRSTALCCLRDF